MPLTCSVDGCSEPLTVGVRYIPHARGLAARQHELAAALRRELHAEAAKRRRQLRQANRPCRFRRTEEATA
jgi:hypothetical protein